MNKPRIAVSFSGGRTSAVMLKLLIDQFDDTHDLKFTFANTGCEHENTLKFVDAVDRHFAGGRVEWIEAVTNGKGVGVTAKQVCFESSSRNGEPFEASIKKHGIFCPTHPQCTSRLKTEAMYWWRKQQGWKPRTYDTAIGIRSDEIDRCSSKAKENRFIYPLVKSGWTKQDVNKYMSQFDWDLNLPSDAWGNCVWCWKKSKRKLLTLAKTNPEVFDFPADMEAKYGHINKSKDQSQKEPRVFFRERTSAKQIVEMAKTETFKPYSAAELNQEVLFDPDYDVGGSCGESCEIGADE